MFANTTATPTASVRTSVLSEDRLRSLAPSIYATEPYHKMSGRYKFTPTIDVVGMLADKGFLPVRAEQSRTRIDGKGDFTRHMLRFRHTDEIARVDALIRPGHHDFAVPDIQFPELVLVNSHDGTSGYQFSAGIFRLACWNGLIVQSATHSSMSVRHTGGSDFHDRVMEATYTIMDDAPKTMAQIEGWKALALPIPAQEAFASAAAELRVPTPKEGSEPLPPPSIKPTEYLRGKRDSDYRNPDGTRDLWKTLNVVQENMMKGGVRGQNATTGRRVTTRPIKSVDADLKTNRALWTLTERMAEIMGAAR